MVKENELLKEKIIKFGKKIGVNELGFVKAEPFLNNKPRFRYAANKGYLSSFINGKEKTETLLEFKSVLCILVPYPNPLFFPMEYHSKGRVSSSSWGEDYHKVLTEILEKFAVFISENSDMKKYHISVDKTAVSEREIAVQAGLGWIGRNSNLINRNLGSFVFIGELYLDLDLDITIEANDISEDLCKTCHICVNACPVQAIDGKRRLINTKLCLSQQTQEKEITNDLVEKKIKETKYIYGCDICQEVCPWNAKQLDFNSLFSPIEKEVNIDLKELSLESNKTFKNKYGKLAGSWRGKKTWQRNARLLLSNLDSKDITFDE